jgi:hypothetical protein
VSRAIASLAIAAAAAAAFFAEGLAMATWAVDRTACDDETCAFDVIWAILVPGFLSLLGFGTALVAALMWFDNRRTEASVAVFFLAALVAFEHWLFL